MHRWLIKRKNTKFIALLVATIVLVIYIVSGQVPVFVFLQNNNYLTQCLSDAVPVFYDLNHINLALVEKAIFGFNLSSPMSIIENNVFAFKAFEKKIEEKNIDNKEEPDEDLSDAKPIKETTISNKNSKGYYEAQGVLVKNATTYNFDPEELLNEPLNFDFSGEGPHILIVHSHSSESYAVTDKNYYLPSDPDRTEDINYNVVRVGTEIENTLKNHGINVLHDTKLHDYPSYNGSYKSSLASVEEYLKKYPSIKIVLDIHRDAMMQADGTKLKLTADVNGQKAAQIMLLTGSNQGGLDHPNWRENLKFAMKLQRTVNSMYPNLARPVSFTKERYNTHTTYGSIIIEVGTNGNTLEEALVSAKCIGNSVAEFVKNNG